MYGQKFARKETHKNVSKHMNFKISRIRDLLQHQTCVSNGCPLNIQEIRLYYTEKSMNIHNTAEPGYNKHCHKEKLNIVIFYRVRERTTFFQKKNLYSYNEET